MLGSELDITQEFGGWIESGTEKTSWLRILSRFEPRNPELSKKS